MIVVSDTSPLNYLILIDAIEILPKLFERVHIPGEVLRELQREIVSSMGGSRHQLSERKKPVGPVADQLC